MLYFSLGIALILSVTVISVGMLFQNAARVAIGFELNEWPASLMDEVKKENGLRNPFLGLMLSFLASLSLPSFFLFAGYYFYCLIQLNWGWFYALVVFVVLVGNFWPVLDQSAVWHRASVNAAVLRRLNQKKWATAIDNYIMSRHLVVAGVSCSGFAALIVFA